jgi:hypothetical protein
MQSYLLNIKTTPFPETPVTIPAQAMHTLLKKYFNEWAPCKPSKSIQCIGLLDQCVIRILCNHEHPESSIRRLASIKKEVHFRAMIRLPKKTTVSTEEHDEDMKQLERLFAELISVCP